MTGSWWARRWPWWALAGLAGMAWQLQQASLLHAGIYGVVALCGAGLMCQRVWRWLRVPGTALLAWALTGLHACAMPEPIDVALEGRDLDVVGVVQAMAQRQDTGWRMRFAIEQAQLAGRVVQVPPQVYLGWYTTSMQEAETPEPLPVLQPGERWRLRVRLKAAHGHINPRGFDYELWLWEQGIRATGYVRQGRGDPAPQRLGQTWRHPVEWARQRVRERLLARLGLDGPGGGAGGAGDRRPGGH